MAPRTWIGLRRSARSQRPGTSGAQRRVPLHPVLAALLVGASLLAGPGAATAQIRPDRGPIEVQARLSPERVYLGSSTTYEIEVKGAKSAEAERPPVPDGVRIQRTGTSVEPAPTLIVNGRRAYTGRDTVTLRYEADASEPGEFTIPETTVRVEDQRFRTNPVTLVVLEPREAEGYTLDLEPARERVYVGQPLRVRIRSLVPREASDYAITGRLAGQGASLHEPSDRSWLGEDRGGIQQIPFLDRQAAARFDRPPTSGPDDAISVTIERIVVANEPGTLDLGRLRAVFTAGERSSDSGGRTRFMSRSEPMEVEVRPLPEEGRPAHFTGLVGAGAIEAEAGAREVSVGDPVELRVRIEAGDPIGRVEPPDLAEQPGVADAFKLAPGGWELTERSTDTASYRTTIRARRSSVEEIPPIELAYFSPESEEYRIARSEAIPLRVRPTTQVDAADAVAAGEGGNNGEGVPANPILSAAPGVRANYTDPALLLSDESPNPLERLPRRAWLAIAAVPPGLWALSVLVGWVQTPAMRARRRRVTALRRAKRAIARAGDDPARIAGAIRRYAADRTLQPARGLTNEECLELLSRAGEQGGIESLGEVLRACNAAEFAGIEPGEEPLATRARRALDGIGHAGGGSEGDAA